jgi:hypothetical protein
MLRAISSKAAHGIGWNPTPQGRVYHNAKWQVNTLVENPWHGHTERSDSCPPTLQRAISAAINNRVLLKTICHGIMPTARMKACYETGSLSMRLFLDPVRGILL